LTADSPPAGGGIFDGFEDYRTPTADDYRRILTDGLVVLDANVLLNLYRYTETTRRDLLDAIRGLGVNLWIPHQVMREFWRNRQFTLDALTDAAGEAIERLDKARRGAESAISVWSSRIALPEELRGRMQYAVDSALAKAEDAIQEQVKADARTHSRNTGEDSVLAVLEPVLAGLVGRPLSPEDYTAAVEEAERRIQAEQPPGYLDKGKDDPELRAGDYLVWEQLLREAERRGADVLFVTSDVKEDWWSRVKGELRGPRLELAVEFRARTGHRLYLLQPKDLLRQVSLLSDVEVDPNTVEEVERVDHRYSLGVPHGVEEQVLPEIYRRADEVGWDRLSSRQKTKFLGSWVEDPDVGGVLADYFPAEGVRVWIKEVPLKEYARAKEGFGRYARYVTMRYQTPEEIVHAVCGDGWSVEPGSIGFGPARCLATNGSSSQNIFWGSIRDFKDLLYAALDKSEDGHLKPMIVLTYHGSQPIEDHSYRRRSEMADRAQVELAYLARTET
jgi:hypothetical protein